MSEQANDPVQPLGFAVSGWSARRRPPHSPIQGRYCRVVSFDPRQHAHDLYNANSQDQEGRMWTYLAYGPFRTLQEYFAEMDRWLKQDWQIHAILDEKTGSAVGLASYMRVEPEAGSIEVGAIMYSPLLQRTPAGTEAMYLLMRRVFDELGYRRYEWRCNALNQNSVNAAKRLGFQFEGIFRQSQVLKGRNRDTAWFSIIDSEWPRLKVAFETWLAPQNFDGSGRQLRSLTEVRDLDYCI